jgi:threonine 3-dehydrogenase
MAKTYLITGGAGNLACQHTFELVERGYAVVLADIAEGPTAPIADGCRYVQFDITRRDQLAAVLGDFRPEVVLHLASLLSGASEANRELAWQVNMDGTFALFEEALAHGVQTVFFPSSLAAYGAPLPNPVPEDYQQWPVGLYGVTKAAIERLGNYYHACHGLDFRSVRLPVVVSAGAPPGAASAYASRAFVETVKDGHFRFQVRPQTRPSLIYVKDVLRAMTQLVEASRENLTRTVYNVQALSPTAEEIATAITARIPTADIRFETDSKIADLIDSWPIEFEDQAAQRDWGWTPQFDLNAMADDFIAQLRGQVD